MKHPRNLDLLADIRRQGLKPSLPCTLHLNQQVQRTEIYSDMPIGIAIGIPASQQIDDLDLRYLVGLSLAIDGSKATNERNRELAKAAVKAKPAYLSVSLADGRLFDWHPERGWSDPNAK